MSDARTYWVKSRLSLEVRKPGGVTARDAVLRAEAAMELSRDACIASIDAILAELEARYGADAPLPVAADHERLYELACSIIDLSICLRDSGIDKAAHALCELADRIAEHGQWNRQSVEIHLKVLQLLRRSGADMTPIQKTRIVSGLRMVTEKSFGENGSD